MKKSSSNVPHRTERIKSKIKNVYLHLHLQFFLYHRTQCFLLTSRLTH